MLGAAQVPRRTGGAVRDLDKWWDKVVDKVKNHIKYWTQKGSSVIDRSLIVKTMLLSKVWYLASVIPMKTDIANEIEKVCFAYLWGSKYDKESDKMTRRPVKVSKAQARKQKYLGGLNFWSVLFAVQSCVSLLKPPKTPATLPFCIYIYLYMVNLNL